MATTFPAPMAPQWGFSPDLPLPEADLDSVFDAHELEGFRAKGEDSIPIVMIEDFRQEDPKFIRMRVACGEHELVHVKLVESSTDPRNLLAIDALRLESPKQFGTVRHSQEKKGLSFSVFKKFLQQLEILAREGGFSGLEAFSTNSFLTYLLYKRVGFRAMTEVGAHFYREVEKVYRSLKRSEIHELRGISLSRFDESLGFFETRFDIFFTEVDHRSAEGDYAVPIVIEDASENTEPQVINSGLLLAALESLKENGLNRFLPLDYMQVDHEQILESQPGNFTAVHNGVGKVIGLKQVTTGTVFHVVDFLDKDRPKILHWDNPLNRSGQAALVRYFD